ncbi:uncharacterized protein F5891DRAFT_1196096 [Suillus fuscotomentosus]|uniref:Uncharacterized protein n=1 Tax=Suillus fuscotomentosus TaxID=1912939 RepID=A0AAD4DUZ9_9AGAM|nr:uncharacterized protein F5891DRAFT_1196096 [Suillus fuscotomentosus]KAG1893659.1 hypothetical protein F5891DRAFT_1196096 [Suillus fuscotomentosus]
MSASHASTSGTLNAGSHYRPLKLSLATISCTLAMAGSRVRACISQYWTEAANNGLSSDRIKYFKAGLQWEMNTFVTPLLQYSASQNIMSVVLVPVAYILKLYPMLTWNTDIRPRLCSHIHVHGGWETPQSLINHGSTVAELQVTEPQPPKFRTRDPGFGTQDSELVTWDLTLF